MGNKKRVICVKCGKEIQHDSRKKHLITEHNIPSYLVMLELYFRPKTPLDDKLTPEQRVLFSAKWGSKCKNRVTDVNDAKSRRFRPDSGEIVASCDEFSWDCDGGTDFAEYVTIGDRVRAWQKLVEKIKEQWREMYDNRIVDTLKAEGIAREDYPLLFIEQGTVIASTRMTTSLTFLHVLEEHRRIWDGHEKSTREVIREEMRKAREKKLWHLSSALG